MGKLTKSQRKAVSQKASEQQSGSSNSVTLQQQNVYHMGASEIEALHRMQEAHPELVDKIMGFRSDELKIQHEIIALEKKEQEIRINEVPYIRKYTFRGQAMAYSLGILSLAGATYFGVNGQIVLAVGFLTSSVGVAFAQFFNKNSKKNEI